MELGKNIKSLRTQYNYSQEDLAELVYVTRQTISKWETEKNYPDLNSLILLSKAFNITIDNLIKGDLEIMKYIVEENEARRFKRDLIVGSVSALVGIALVFATQMIFLFGTIAYFIGMVGGFLLGLVGAILFIKWDFVQKKYDIRSFKEIIAFSKGETLDEIAKAKEAAKSPYQYALFIIIAIVIVVVLKAILLSFSPNDPVWMELWR
jgi:transcriptional regulator with XRE-family HTH domain